MSLTWDIIGCIYVICLIPAILLTVVLKNRLNMSTLLIFGTVWLVLPLFPIWCLVKKLQNNG